MQANGLLQEALTKYHKSIELNPNSSLCYYNLGSVLLKLEKWQEAIIAYRTSVEINPGFPWSYYSIGEACDKLEKWSESAAAYQQRY